jgi:hypothetical protein
MIRRERDARRVAKSIRNHEETMEAYGNASGWLRINSKAFGDKYDSESWNPSVKRGDRASGDVMHPKSTNQRAKIEMESVAKSRSEPRRIGHTIGKGHVATDQYVAFREYQRDKEKDK